LQRKELRVAKKRVAKKRRYSGEFRRRAVERMINSENIVALTEELGVSRRQLYRWRDQQDLAKLVEQGEGVASSQNSRESTLRNELNQLKRVLAEKTLEVDFFKSALQKVEARRQRSSRSGEKASTVQSGN
jgi:transposase-like protein